MRNTEEAQILGNGEIRSSDEDRLLDLYKLDYEKSVEISVKLEHSKLSYQKFYISMVSVIGTISIGFLKLNIFKANESVGTIENLIGCLLLFSSILGYAIIRNLVSLRRQCIHFNNAIIYLREQLINNLHLEMKYPSLKKVPANHLHSADYITILLCSIINLSMLAGGLMLLLNLPSIKPIPLTLILVTVFALYAFIHNQTIEKVLRTDL